MAGKRPLVALVTIRRRCVVIPGPDARRTRAVSCHWAANRPPAAEPSLFTPRIKVGVYRGHQQAYQQAYLNSQQAC